MADIKIDRLKFTCFLAKVIDFIDSIDKNKLPATQQAVANEIREYASVQIEITELMEKRKLFYEFYKKNYSKDPDKATEMYSKYLETKEKIEELRECI
jgi:hypothetical protein